MSKSLLLMALLFVGMYGMHLDANCQTKDKEDALLRRSSFFDKDPYIANTSFPGPFSELNNNIAAAAVSTGYYFVDSDDEASDYWRPTPEIIDTMELVSQWRRIVQGPRMIPREYWENNPDEGQRFFRNPALPGAGRSFFNDGEINATDSTDDAIAGPIPIGFPFYFNGLRYDSFYVSTNGIIALTNRRYFYNSEGQRIIPAGNDHSYDPMSMDWFANGRQRSGNGLNDPARDNYGYFYSVCGGNPDSRLAGIRTRNTSNLSGLPNKAAVIAPFWGDNQLSQYHAAGSQVDDWGKAFFRKSGDGKLMIYFVNMSPVRSKSTPNGDYYSDFDLRPGERNYTSANAQVTFDRNDSSVTIVYERFDGVAIVNGRGVPSNTVFRYNTSCGVRGFARHVNYGSKTGTEYPWASEYEQYTNYFSHSRLPNDVYPHNYLAIKFKQWKNVLRVADIRYRVRNQDPNEDLEFSETIKSENADLYELLAGEERIGAIQPVVLVQNLTNHIQGPNGINFQSQELNFRCRVRITNLSSGRIVFNRLVPIDSTCLAIPDSLSYICTGDPYVKVKYASVSKSGSNYNVEEKAFPGADNLKGIPPYGFTQVIFPPFEPNEFLDNHIGLMKLSAIAEPINPANGESLGGEWPFDDTTHVRIFVMRRLEEFNDDATEYHIIERTPVPSVLKWVNIGAEIGSGDEVSHYPVPPRGEFEAANNENYTLQSPTIRMNRTKSNGSEYSESPGGDELRSFPIDMRGRHDAVLSLSIQRSTKQDDWPRGWCDGQLIGPEPRTFVNGDLLSIFGVRYAGSNYTYTNAASREPDKIAVEIMQPSPDGVQFITNTPDKRWRNHPRRGGLKPVTDVPAYELYGSNGYFMGFLEADKDSSLTRENPSAGLRNGLRPNIFDDGIDYGYSKAFIGIPDTFINSDNEGAKFFRFRIRVLATNDKKCDFCIPDDDDPFYVDNVKILFPSEITDIEVSKVRIDWPYSIAPATQATNVPIRVTFSNNTSVDAPTFWAKVKVFRSGSYGWEQEYYCRTYQLPFLNSRKEVEQRMPSWNPRRVGDGAYRIYAYAVVPGGDLEPYNDTTYTDVRLRFGDVFAYDPPNNVVNDVQTFTGIKGRGLNLYGFSEGGSGRITGPSGIYNEDLWGAGYPGGSGSGQIAMKFKLTNADTIFGYQAFFGKLNQSMDDITLAIYTDQADNQPGTQVPNSRIYRFRGWDDKRDHEFWGEYVTYLLKSPLVLPAGTYWAVIAQLGETGLELGASKSRSGMRTTNVYIPPPVTFVNRVGGSGIHLMLDENFRKNSISGNNLINNNIFAYENTRGGGSWHQFYPTSGNPAYAHLHHFGITPADNQTATLSRGSWIPMIRPYLGLKEHGYDLRYDPCPSDPVELLSFEGNPVNNGVELSWVTSTEINNKGFYVERSELKNDIEGEWNSVGYVEGSGNTNINVSYSYLDQDVILNTTYKYRLRQVDLDGTQSCPAKPIVVSYHEVSELKMESPKPNPFTDETRLVFNLPYGEHVRLDIIDLTGNPIKTLINGTLTAKQHEVRWNGKDSNGRQVANGTYMYRLSAGSNTVSGTITKLK